MGRAIQHEVQSVDPELPVANIAEMKEIVNLGLGDRRFAAWLLGIFAALAILFTSVGIYGVTSYAISRRTKEMGIRSALGALPSDLIRMIVMNGMTPIVGGMAAGTLGAIPSARMIAALLYAVRPTDAASLCSIGTNRGACRHGGELHPGSPSRAHQSYDRYARGVNPVA